MVRNLLVRGMLVGILGGLLVFAFAKLFGEPLVDQAIAFEDHMHQMAGDAPEPEIVSRAIQSSIGLLTGVLVYGTAIGGIFSLVFAYAQGRLGRLDARMVAALIALAGFVAIILVPQLKYPANPPSIGNPETIGLRTGLYFGMIAISIIAMVAALNLGRGMVARFGLWNAAIAGVLTYIVVIGIAYYALPPINEVPADFSATVLWNFRVVSLGMHIILWSALGLGFGALVARSRTVAVNAKLAVKPR